MPTPTPPDLRRSHLLARLPTRAVPAFLKKLQASGVSLDPVEFDEPSVMDASTEGESVVMAWVTGTPALFQRWRREAPVLSLQDGVPYVSAPATRKADASQTASSRLAAPTKKTSRT